MRKFVGAPVTSVAVFRLITLSLCVREVAHWKCGTSRDRYHHMPTDNFTRSTTSNHMLHFGFALFALHDIPHTPIHPHTLHSLNVRAFKSRAPPILSLENTVANCKHKAKPNEKRKRKINHQNRFFK